MRKSIKRIAIGFTSTLTIAIAAFIIFTPQSVHATAVIGFNPGYIISDNILTNSQTMSAAQIQSFLNAKVPSCDTNGVLIATEYGSTLTHAQYAASRGWSGPPFTCLKDYSENGRVAAQIIYDAAQKYQVNPQVLLVLLQKEQGLVTDTWPISSQYRSATGYGCPDTAACDSQYYGLTNQINWAATMYHSIMTKSPTWYSPYFVGNNFVAYNPNSSCGGTTVSIQNLATVALYDYTPYQPNQSALNAGYGSGDSCSAYGNRNFYQYFSDWFGSPQYGNLVRSANDATVFLVSGTNKYPISDINILGSLYPLGGVTFVNQTYLNSLTTGATLGRVVQGADGTEYFYDSGIKLPFTSCTQVSDYGASCGQSIILEDGQLGLLSNGPAMTNLYQTTSGKRFYVVGGVKREVYDDQSLTQAGIVNGSNTLSEMALNNLTYGAPVIRDGAGIKDRSSGTVSLYSATSVYSLDSSITQLLSSVTTRPLDTQSIHALTQGTDLKGFVKSSAGTSYILTNRGKLPVTAPQDWSVNFTQLSDAVLNQIPITSAVDAPYTVTFGDGTIHYLTGGTLRPIASWNALLAINANPTIISLPASYSSAFTEGALVLTPNTLVKSQGNGTVYLIDGLNKKIPMSTFGPATELGVNSLSTISDSNLSGYATSSGVLTDTLTCGTKQGMAIGGFVYPIVLGGVAYTTLDPITCASLQWKTTNPSFLLSTNGTIYQVDTSTGIKRPILSYAKYVSLGGTGANTLRASDYVLAYFTDGPIL